MKEPTIIEAVKLIEKYPHESDYIEDNYDAHLEDGSWRDNLTELSEYYDECKTLVKEYLFNKHG